MVEQAGVTFTLSAFKRAGFVGGGKPILLQADQDDAVALKAMDEAASAVNEALLEHEGRDEAYVQLNGAVPTPFGQVCLVRDCEPAKAVPLMLDTLAAELTDRGITGRLSPAKPARPIARPKGVVSSLGMVFSPINDIGSLFADFDQWHLDRRQIGLRVEEDRHQRVVTRVVEWLTEIDGQVLIEDTEYFEIGADALVPYLTDALRSENLIGVGVTAPDGRTYRSLRYEDSEYILRDYAPDRPRSEQLASLTDLAVDLAPDLTYALVRELATFVISMKQCDRVPPTIPLFRNLTYTCFVKHLEADYVFDAGVAQVLTTSQLTKTSLPPKRWTVRDLGDDRHLVTANDPDPWLHPDPLQERPSGQLMADWTDHDVIATARADFEPAILTLDTLRDNPPPISPDQIRTDPTMRRLGVEPPQ